MDRDEDLFLLFLPEPPTAGVAQAIEDEMRCLGSSRAWSIAPPAIVDVTDPVEDCGPEDIGAPSTIGVSLAVPSSQRSPDADRRGLEDCQAVFDSVARLSATHNIAFEVEMNGEGIGAVSGGVLDKGLTKGLFE